MGNQVSPGMGIGTGPADGLTPFGSITEVVDFLMVWNGTTWDRAASQGAGGTNKGVLLAAPPLPTWYLLNSPGANSKATASQAAGAAGVRHVCTFWIATVAASAAATGIQLAAVLIDGASGGGTYLGGGVTGVQTAAGNVGPAVYGVGQFRGSAATAMTVEFTGAGGGNVVEIVFACGYDITA